MTAPEFSARRVGRQWQIWRGAAFYCLASDRYGRAARTREAAEQCAARHERAARDALASEYCELIGYDPFADDPSRDPREVAATLNEYKRERRLAAARAYLEKRARRPRSLAFSF